MSCMLLVIVFYDVYFFQMYLSSVSVILEVCYFFGQLFRVCKLCIFAFKCFGYIVVLKQVVQPGL